MARGLVRRGLRDSGFSAFAEAVCEIPDERANPHFRSQHVGLILGGELLPDFVGRFENLEEDFAVVAETIGSPRLRLPHLTRSSSRGERHYRDLYDDGLAERVGERFRKDAEPSGILSSSMVERPGKQDR